MTDFNVLSNDFKVLAIIYEETVIKKNIVNYGKLKTLCSDISEKDVSRIYDRAYDLRMIDTSWQNIDGTWVNCITIDDSFLPFIQGLYNCLEDHDNVKEKISINNAKEDNKQYSAEEITRKL